MKQKARSLGNAFHFISPFILLEFHGRIKSNLNPGAGTVTSYCTLCYIYPLSVMYLFVINNFGERISGDFRAFSRTTLTGIF
jgi:hypothetical protein